MIKLDYKKIKKKLMSNNLSYEFINLVLKYVEDLKEEADIQSLKSIKDSLNYYNELGGVTVYTKDINEKLKEYRNDIRILYENGGGEVFKLDDYFNNINKFELDLLYYIYINFIEEYEIYIKM